MKYKFIYLTLFFTLLLSACGTTKYESAVVEIDQSYQTAGSVRFSVDLIKENGRIKRIKPNKNRSKWSNIQFSGENVIGVSRGNLKYGMANLTKENHTIKVRMASEKYGFQKDFFVKVPYVVGINVRTKSIELNNPTELEYDLVLNTGEVIPRDSRHFPNELFENHSETMVQFKDGKIQVDSYVPLINKKLEVCFLHKLTRDTLWKNKLDILYPNEVTLNHAGENGKDGSNGYSGSSASQSGSNGANGSNGGNGGDLSLYLQYYGVEGNDFVIATVDRDGQYRRIFLPKSTGRIYVDVHGGKGGNGGEGGSGKDAAYPVTTTVNGKTTTTKPSVYGGDAGNGGDGGHGGRGGNVYVYMEDQLIDFRNNIQIDVKGGVSGVPGRSGNAGRGINTKGQLGGWFNYNNGKSGSTGRAGVSGTDGRIDGPVLLKKEELYKRFTFLNKVNQ
jgi:uncharacterized membrane protein YgcG